MARNLHSRGVMVLEETVLRGGSRTMVKLDATHRRERPGDCLLAVVLAVVARRLWLCHSM